MARVSREEWFAGLKVGDTASATLPDDESPSVGTVEVVNDDGVLVRFAGREIPMHFKDGSLLGSPSCLLWMVATGGGGSTAPAIQISNVLETLEERRA